VQLEAHVVKLTTGQPRVELRQKNGTVVFVADFQPGADQHQHLLYTLLPNQAISDLKQTVTNDIPLRDQQPLSDAAAVTHTQVVYKQVVGAIRGDYDGYGCDKLYGDIPTLNSCGSHGACCDNHDYCYFSRRNSKGERCTAASWLPGDLQKAFGYTYNPDCSVCNTDVLWCGIAQDPAMMGPSECCDPANGHTCGMPRTGDTFEIGAAPVEATSRVVDPAAPAADPQNDPSITNLNAGASAPLPTDPNAASTPAPVAPTANGPVPGVEATGGSAAPEPVIPDDDDPNTYDDETESPGPFAPVFTDPGFGNQYDPAMENAFSEPDDQEGSD
jgi:hypothetical protein